MVDRDLLHKKSEFVQELLARAGELGDVDFKTFKDDHQKQAIILFNLEKAAQDCLDLAAHVVSDQGWAMGDQYRDLFPPLEQHGIIPHDLAEFMQEFTGFRNVLVHRYGFLSHEKAYRFYQERHRLAEFCGAVLRHFNVLE